MTSFKKLIISSLFVLPLISFASQYESCTYTLDENNYLSTSACVLSEPTFLPEIIVNSDQTAIITAGYNTYEIPYFEIYSTFNVDDYQFGAYVNRYTSYYTIDDSLASIDIGTLADYDNGAFFIDWYDDTQVYLATSWFWKKDGKYYIDDPFNVIPVTSSSSSASAIQYQDWLQVNLWIIFLLTLLSLGLFINPLLKFNKN